MKTSIVRAMIIGFSGLTIPISAWASGVTELSGAETPIEVGYQLESSVATTYVSRGVPQYVSRDDPSSQTTLAVRLDHFGPGSLTLGVWNATAMNRLGDQPGTAIQVDLSALYRLELASDLELGVGYVVSLCPMQPDADASINPVQEATFSLGYHLELFTPSVFVAVEVAHQYGAYAALAVARDFAFGPLTLTPSVNVGVAAYLKYGGAEIAAAPHLNDVTASLDAKLALFGDAYALLRTSWALRGTPAELMGDADPNDRSTLFAQLAVGIAR